MSTLHIDDAEDRLAAMPKGESVVVAEDSQIIAITLAIHDFAKHNIALQVEPLDNGGTRLTVVHVIGQIDDKGNTVNIIEITPTTVLTRRDLAVLFQEVGLTPLDEETRPS